MTRPPLWTITSDNGDGTEEFISLRITHEPRGVLLLTTDETLELCQELTATALEIMDRA